MKMKSDDIKYQKKLHNLPNKSEIKWFVKVVLKIVIKHKNMHFFLASNAYFITLK